jgi:hypothetical protein
MIESKNDVVHSQPEAQQRQPTIAVDFDGVIAEYDGWKGADVLGPPREDVVQVLHILEQEKWKIVVHTTRSEQDIIHYLRTNKVPFHEINQNSDYQNLGSKPVATIYWDDRALNYSGNALQDLKRIRDFYTWSGRR